MQIQDAKAQGMWLMVWPDVSEKQLSRHPYPGISASPKEWNITIFFIFFYCYSLQLYLGSFYFWMQIENV